MRWSGLSKEQQDKAMAIASRLHSDPLSATFLALSVAENPEYFENLADEISPEGKGRSFVNAID